LGVISTVGVLCRTTLVLVSRAVVTLNDRELEKGETKETTVMPSVVTSLATPDRTAAILELKWSWSWPLRVLTMTSVRHWKFWFTSEDSMKWGDAAVDGLKIYTPYNGALISIPPVAPIQHRGASPSRIP